MAGGSEFGRAMRRHRPELSSGMPIRTISRQMACMSTDASLSSNDDEQDEGTICQELSDVVGGDDVDDEVSDEDDEDEVSDDDEDDEDREEKEDRYDHVDVCFGFLNSITNLISFSFALGNAQR